MLAYLAIAGIFGLLVLFASEPEGGVAPAEPDPEDELISEQLRGLPGDDGLPPDPGDEPYEGPAAVDEVPADEARQEPAADKEKPTAEVADEDAREPEKKEAAPARAPLDLTLVQMARTYGVPEATLAALPTTEALTAYLNGLADRQQRGKTAPSSAEDVPSAVELPKLDPEDVSPQVIEYLDKLHQHHDRQVNDLRSRLDTTQEGLEQAARNAQAEMVARENAWLDDQFDRLTKSSAAYRERFGAGSMAQLAGSPEAEARNALVRAQRSLEAGGWSANEAFQLATHALCNDLKATIAREQLNAKVVDQAKGATVAPTRTGAKVKLTADQDALATMDEILRQHGVRFGD